MVSMAIREFAEDVSRFVLIVAVWINYDDEDEDEDEARIVKSPPIIYRRPFHQFHLQRAQ